MANSPNTERPIIAVKQYTAGHATIDCGDRHYVIRDGLGMEIEEVTEDMLRKVMVHLDAAGERKVDGRTLRELAQEAGAQPQE